MLTYTQTHKLISLVNVMLIAIARRLKITQIINVTHILLYFYLIYWWMLKALPLIPRDFNELIKDH